MKDQSIHSVTQSLDIRTTQLNKSQQETLLRLAKEAITNYLKTGRMPKYQVNDPLLMQGAGAFVTIRQKGVLEDPLEESGSLRGCIGHMIGDRPLYLVVAQMAIEAASSDPRFNPLTVEELPNITIEISVLSPLEQITDIEEIKIGEHGVVIFGDGRRALLLPQVAPRFGWTREEFLMNLCRKAWLPHDYWRSEDAKIEIFTCQSFSDQEFLGSGN